MPAVTCEGIILKRNNFGEADRMLTIFTDRFGKISVVARGVRKITSRRAGNVELLNKVKLHLFHSKSFTLTEAESIEDYPQIKENLTLSTTGFHIIELISKLTNENEKNLQVYSLLLEALKLLEENPRQIFMRAFEVKLLSLAGFWGIAQIGSVDSETKKILSGLETKSFAEISQMRLSSDQALALECVLRYYLEKVLETSLKSSRVLRQIKNGRQKPR